MKQQTREFQEVFQALQQKIGDVKMRTAAVVADAYAVLERVRRSRARRVGKKTSKPEADENFVNDRSKYSH